MVEILSIVGYGYYVKQSLGTLVIEKAGEFTLQINPD